MSRKETRSRIILIDFAVIVVAAIVLAVSMAWPLEIELSLGLAHYEYVDAEDVSASDNESGDVTVSAASGSSLKLHFVNVWQGDCTIIEFPDGKTMIIDGGENNSKTETAIRTFIENTLPSDFKYFDYAILTHADSDHCGSMDYILGLYPARVSYRPNVEANMSGFSDPGKADLTSGASKKSTGVYKNIIEVMYAATDDFTPIVHVTDPGNDEQTISGGTGEDAYTYTFYTPLSEKYSDSNNYSPIMVLEYRGFKFALSGDAEAKNEEEFVAKVNAAKTDGVTDKYDVFTDDYCVNLVKLGHHGSRTSSSQAYLDIMTTEDGAKSAYYIVSSNREGNKYGHPHEETLTRLANMGVPDENILRTDTLGDISLSVRVGDDGVYSLYYGDKASGNNNTPKERVLVYRELFGIKLRWRVVAWVCYAVLVVALVIHMIFAVVGGSDSSGKSSGKGSRGRRR